MDFGNPYWKSIVWILEIHSMDFGNPYWKSIVWILEIHSMDFGNPYWKSIVWILGLEIFSFALLSTRNAKMTQTTLQINNFMSKKYLKEHQCRNYERFFDTEQNCLKVLRK
jgi:hypothetical protein